MSIGYDLAGIRTQKVRRFIEGMIDATASVERLRNQLPHRLSRLRELDYPTRLSNSVTLSTFHGCPAEEIERICEFLLAEIGVHTIVKMNPPMLGKERLEHLLYDVLGYRELTVNPSAYTSGLAFAESIGMCERLTELAKSRGLGFGAKFSNTLEVLNHRDFFAKKERVMYMSGPPLHVITLALADVFRQAVGPELPISFSAGVDRKNFPNMVACGFVPVTTCTDLLKTGGYGRLPAYLDELAAAMRAVGASTIDDYVFDARGQRAAAGGDARRAGWLNTSIIAAETAADERYTAARNRVVPPRINSHLLLFDCITCDKCVPVCPNDANFLYETPPVESGLPRRRGVAGRNRCRMWRGAAVRRGAAGADRQLRRLLQLLRQLRHVLSRVGRALFEEAELFREPGGVRRGGWARRSLFGGRAGEFRAPRADRGMGVSLGTEGEI